MTLDAATVELGGCFVSGQAYVALSRARSLQNVSLLDLPQSFGADPRVVQYYERLHGGSLEETLKQQGATSEAASTTATAATSSTASTAKSGGVRLETVTGDVTEPFGSDVRCIVHLADDSGIWCDRGLFRALAARRRFAADVYEHSAAQLGDALLSADPSDRRVFVSTLIAQRHTRDGTPPPFVEAAFEQAFCKLLLRPEAQKIRSFHLSFDDSLPALDAGRLQRIVEREMTKAKPDAKIFRYLFNRGR